jgi:hypothetical protein
MGMHMGMGMGDMGSMGNGANNMSYGRMRSSSMSMIDRSEAAWAILGNTGGYRSKCKRSTLSSC